MTLRGLRRLAALAAISALAVAQAAGQAAIEGRVALPKPLHAPVMNKRYGIVSFGGVLTPYPPVAVVYLEGSFPASGAPPATAQMTQKDLMFLPSILPVLVGTRVEFPNLDDTYHNIFSYSPAKRFDLGRYRSDERPIPSEVFDVVGLVTLRCDIHEHMRALILVLDTPHFVVSDGEGRYRLEGLPAGRFTVKVWLDSKTTLGRAVDLQAGQALHADFP
jgi:plastocyanin